MSKLKEGFYKAVKSRPATYDEAINSHQIYTGARLHEQMLDAMEAYLKEQEDRMWFDDSKWSRKKRIITLNKSIKVI